MSVLAAMPATMLPHTISKARALRIIYAEDLRDLREVARISLTREGHAIECVEDGSVALARLTATPDAFDLLLTDHHMPVKNGLELVAAVRTLPFAGKIIVFSSELSSAVATEYRKLSVDLILPKPIFPSELRRVLAEMFPAIPGDAVGHLARAVTPAPVRASARA